MTYQPEIIFINSRVPFSILAHLKAKLRDVFELCPDSARVVSYFERLANGFTVKILVRSPAGTFSVCETAENEITAFEGAQRQIESVLLDWKRHRIFESDAKTV